MKQTSLSLEANLGCQMGDPYPDIHFAIPLSVNIPISQFLSVVASEEA
jgi:hypothetical protein